MTKSIRPRHSASTLPATARNEVISAHFLPPMIMGGIVDLMIAFPAGPAMSDADRTRKLQIYGENLAGFEVSVAEYVLKRMRIYNPNNPFPPTPQDVFEECSRVRNLWCERVQSYFIGGDGWLNSFGFHDQLKIAGGEKAEPFGPPPFASGCWITPAMIEEFLRPAIAAAYEEMRKREDSGGKIPLTEFEKISAERFYQIPEGAFDGKREEIASMREKRRERYAEFEQLRKQLLTKFEVGAAVVDRAIGGLIGIVHEIDERNERVVVRFNHGKQGFRIWGQDFSKLELDSPRERQRTANKP